jgi:hypothetical protein
MLSGAKHLQLLEEITWKQTLPCAQNHSLPNVSPSSVTRH